MAIEERTLESMTAADVQERIDAARPGEEIELGPGRIRGRLIISKPIVLRGAGAGVTVIDAQESGPAISVDAGGGVVSIEEMSITGGRSALGAGVSIDNGAEAEIIGCMLERNSARSGRGGAVGIDRGVLRIKESTLVSNEARVGGGIFVGGDATVEVWLSIIAENRAQRGGGLAAVDGATLNVWTCRLAKNLAELEGHHLYCARTLARRPRVTLLNAALGITPAAGLAISNERRVAAELTIDHSTVAREFAQTAIRG
ncbi:MAG: hypothetical protein U1E65_11335 [Myxococcota bacterium]